MIIQVEPVIDYKTRDWCLLPYPDHPKGCPNYGKSAKCPPQIDYFDKIYNMSKPVFAIVGDYNLKAHIDKMWLKHPNWTDRQLRCVLYWQQTARKELWKDVNKWISENPGYYPTQCAEAMGVNLVKTMHKVGINLEFPPKEKVNLVVLAGVII